MDPRRLRTLLAIARLGSVIAAAEELFITPSAVSQQIRQLEREAGRDLVMRTPRGTVLTPAGLIAAQAAEEIERVIGSANDRLKEDDGANGTVRIGGLASFLRTVLVPRLSAWREAHPQLHVEFVEGNTPSLMRSLRRRELHAAVVELDPEAEDEPLPTSMVEQPLLDEPWRLVVPSVWMLDRERLGDPKVTLPWLGVDARTTEAAIERLRRFAKLDPAPSHLYYESANGLSLVAAEQGVTVMPALTLHGMPADKVRILEVPGLGSRSIVLRQFRGKHAPDGPINTVIRLINDAVSTFGSDPI